jgi:selenocysteine lyase/cysteine desulfurase
VLPVAIEALKLLKQCGAGNVFNRLQHLNNVIWQEAEKRELSRRTSSFCAPHISVLDFGERVQPDLASILKRENVHVTVRGSKVRISPHIYNDEDDIMKLFNALSSALAR